MEYYARTQPARRATTAACDVNDLVGPNVGNLDDRMAHQTGAEARHRSRLTTNTSV